MLQLELLRFAGAESQIELVRVPQRLHQHTPTSRSAEYLLHSKGREMLIVESYVRVPGRNRFSKTNSSSRVCASAGFLDEKKILQAENSL